MDDDLIEAAAVEDSGNADQVSKTSRLVRFGFFACGAAAFVTLVGTILLSQGAGPLEQIGSVVHRSGLTLLLVGFVVVLIGYRMPQLRALYDQMKESVKHDANPAAQPGTTPTSNQVHWRFGLSDLFVLMTVAAIYVAALFATPSSVLPLVFAFIHLLIVSSMIVIVVYDRGLLRVFCIAALVPTIMLVVTSFGFGGFRILTGGMPGGAVQLRLMALAYAFATVVIGLAGVGVRVWCAWRSQPSVANDPRI